MQQIPDHPVIQAMERTGYPDGKEPRMPKCPICGEPCHTVYSSWMTEEIFACNNCLTTDDAACLLEEEETDD